MHIEVTREAMNAMQNAARREHPQEACGLLLGEGVRITQFIETGNVHPTPQSHFELDPQALIDAHRAHRQGGPRIMGYFHSHPSGKAVPSPTDQAMAARDGKIWAIIAGEDIAFWRDAKEGFEPLSYCVVEA